MFKIAKNFIHLKDLKFKIAIKILFLEQFINKYFKKLKKTAPRFEVEIIV